MRLAITNRPALLYNNHSINLMALVVLDGMSYLQNKCEHIVYHIITQTYGLNFNEKIMVWQLLKINKQLFNNFNMFLKI